MSTAALTSLAILKVNWDRLGRDYIENFVPFVGEALRESTDDVVSLTDLQSRIRTHFGLDLPLNPLRQILQRAAKRGFVRRESGVFHRNPERLAGLDFAATRDAVVASYDGFLGAFRDFIRAERGEEWTEARAAEAIHAFLGEQSLKLLYALAENTPLAVSGSPRTARYLVASFLVKCRQSNPRLFEDFITLVKGNLLASAIYLPDPGRVAQRFRSTRVYLDSTILVYAAGFAGPERQAPCEELLRLLRDYGATLHCFELTYREVRGILDACAARLRENRLRDAYGPTIEWFIESGRSASDIELMGARLPEKLRTLGITVEEPPTREREFQVDEKGFEAALQNAIHYRNPRAREHDVDCISAVAQLRRGRHSHEVESCGALFVTSNFVLAKVARQFFQADAPEGAAALAITDYALGNLLWLKNPTGAPELPQKLLIADSFAALQPPDALWKAYLAEIARLEERGQITFCEFFALRHSLTAKRALMEMTGGDETAFAEGTVAEVLKVAKESLRADLKDEVALERQRREAAESRATEMEQRDKERRERNAARAGTAARAVAKTALVVLFLLLAAGALLTFPWSLPRLRDAWYRYLTTFLLLALFLYTLASMLWGTSVSAIANGLEVRLARRFTRWLALIGD